jgi:RHS repeat-associated protein
MNVNSSGTVFTSASQCSSSAPAGNVLDLEFNWNGGSSDNGTLAGWAASGALSFSRTYSYDSLNRLYSMSSPGDPSGCTGLQWTYDAWGNRTDQSVTSGTCGTFHATVLTSNRLGSPYQYDAAGNMTYDGTHSYTYDAENRLIQVDGGSTGSYVYDGSGVRASKTTAAGSIDFVHDTAGNVMAEWTPTGNMTGFWSAGYIYLGRQLLAEYLNSTTYFIHPDHLGSTRALTTVTQSVSGAVDYGPFGEQFYGGVGITHKFTGLEQDAESGQNHTWFRQYSPAMGRWPSPDPAGVAAVDPTNPQSWNRYSYVWNAPCELTDPLGLDPGCKVSVAVGGFVSPDVLGQMQQILAQANIGVDFTSSPQSGTYTLNYVDTNAFRGTAGTVYLGALGVNYGTYGIVYANKIVGQLIVEGSGTATGTLATSLAAIGAHEIAHSLGLADVGSTSNLMGPGTHVNSGGFSLTAQQIADLQKGCKNKKKSNQKGPGGGAGGGPNGPGGQWVWFSFLSLCHTDREGIQSCPDEGGVWIWIPSVFPPFLN